MDLKTGRKDGGTDRTASSRDAAGVPSLDLEETPHSHLLS